MRNNFTDKLNALQELDSVRESQKHLEIASLTCNFVHLL